MKRKIFFAATLVALFVVAGTVSGDSRRILVKDILFDGYCDGLHLVIDTSTGVVTGHATGCFADAIVGTFGRIKDLNCITYVYETHPIPLSVIRADRTFTHYEIDGSIINEGTFSPGVPPKAAGFRSFD
jgi:hypothetical protein